MSSHAAARTYDVGGDRLDPPSAPRHAPGMIQRTCPFCGGTPSGVIGAKDDYRILRCGTCTLQFSEFVPEEAALPALYDEHYFHGSPAGYPAYEHDEPIHRERAREYLRDIGRHVPPGALLDVGCATGFFLDEARRAGWRVQGWEVSEWAADYARRNLGLDVTVGSFPTGAPADWRFDVVTFLNVLEQLPDPRAAERALHRMVRPGGIVAVETWDADATVVKLLGMRWHKYRPRETPFYINRRSLAALFPPERWRLLEFRPRTKWISLEHGLHALGLRRRPHAAPGGARGRSLLDLSLPYRLGDLVWVVLERRGDGD